MDAIYFTNLNGKFVDVNSATADLLGYTWEEILELNTKDFYVNPGDRKIFQEEIEKGGSVKEFEVKLRKNDGTMIDCLLSATVRTAANGSIEGYQGIIRDITEYKRVEKNLMASQKYTQNIINSSLDMIIAVDNRRRITEFNKAAEDTFGYSRGEVLGRHVNLLYANIKEGLEIHNKTVKNRYNVQEVLNRRKNGEVFLSLLSASILIDSAENRVGVMGVSRDISEQKEAERSLRESEERFRTIFESEPECVKLLDKNGTVSRMNPAGLKLVEADTPDQVEGKSVYPLISPEYRSAFMAFNAKVFHGESRIMEFEITGLKGKTRLLESHAVPIRDMKGEVISLLAVTRDITERKQAERALQESEEKFRGVIEQSNDGIYVLQGYRFVFINPRFTEITGFELEEISGKDFDFEKLVAEEGLKVIEEREAMIERGEEPPNRYIFKSLRKDGERMDLEVSLTTVDWQGAPAKLGVLHDVTERIQTQKELEDALEKAQEGERIKSLFMANMSHEIRTPLNAILGFTDLLDTSTRDLIGEEEKDFFDTIRNSCDRLMKTVHEILDISQIEVGTYKLKMEQLDLVKLVRSLAPEFQTLADNKSLKLVYKFKLEAAFITADQNGVSQAISNIIDNAIKYTDKGRITVILRQSSNQYILSIQDTGVGITKEYLSKLYDAFSQESEGYTKTYQGIGLGLAIAKRHMDLNQVYIDVESTKNVGTTFTLTFQPVQKPKKKIEKKDTPVKQTFEKPLVLLVEDDPNSQKLVEFYLKGQYELYFAVSVDEAKEQLKKNPIDLILLDLSLVGNEDGLDLVRWMRKTKTWLRTTVIATTAHAFAKDRDNCIAAGCNDYLAKPITREKLIEKISKYV